MAHRHFPLWKIHIETMPTAKPAIQTMIITMASIPSPVEPVFDAVKRLPNHRLYVGRAP